MERFATPLERRIHLTFVLMCLTGLPAFVLALDGCGEASSKAFRIADKNGYRDDPAAVKELARLEAKQDLASTIMVISAFCTVAGCLGAIAMAPCWLLPLQPDSGRSEVKGESRDCSTR